MAVDSSPATLVSVENRPVGSLKPYRRASLSLRHRNTRQG